jgi:hypothetical protein
VATCHKIAGRHATKVATLTGYGARTLDKADALVAAAEIPISRCSSRRRNRHDINDGMGTRVIEFTGVVGGVIATAVMAWLLLHL